MINLKPGDVFFYGPGRLGIFINENLVRHCAIDLDMLDPNDCSVPTEIWVGWFKGIFSPFNAAWTIEKCLKTIENPNLAEAVKIILDDEGIYQEPDPIVTCLICKRKS